MTQTRQRPGGGSPDAINTNAKHSEFVLDSITSTEKVPNQSPFPKGINPASLIRERLNAGTLSKDLSPVHDKPISWKPPKRQQSKLPEASQPDESESEEPESEDLTALDLDAFRTAFIGLDLDYALNELKYRAGPTHCYLSRPSIITTGLAPGRLGRGTKHRCRARLECMQCRNHDFIEKLARAVEVHRHESMLRVLRFDSTGGSGRFDEKYRKRRRRAGHPPPERISVPQQNGATLIVTPDDHSEGERLEHREAIAQLALAIAAYLQRPKNSIDNRKISGLVPESVPNILNSDMKTSGTSPLADQNQPLATSLDGEETEFLGFGKPGEDITNEDLEDIAKALDLSTQVDGRGQVWVNYQTEEERKALVIALKNKHGLRTTADMAARRNEKRERERHQDREAEREWYR